MTSPWIKRVREVPDARIRLYCIAHAGAGASTFRSWPAGLPADVEVCAIQLPGREERLMDTLISSATDHASALADELDGELDRPWAIFGNSMGGLISFELLRELRRRGVAPPACFIASAHRAPQLPKREPCIHELSDADFVREVNERYDAVPAEVAADEGLMELLLPTLRADVTVCDTYAYAQEAPLDCPIHAFGGEGDGQLLRYELEGWREQTRAQFELTIFPGDHFFLHSAEASVLETVSRALGDQPS